MYSPEYAKQLEDAFKLRFTDDELLARIESGKHSYNTSGRAVRIRVDQELGLDHIMYRDLLQEEVERLGEMGICRNVRNAAKQGV